MRSGSRRSGDPTTSPRSASLDDTYLSSPMKRAPFYFAFIWFWVQGSGFRVQGSRFKVQGGGFAAFFLEDGILVSQPSPLGHAIKLRKSLAT